ncbi:MAG TPA: hypothetical protein VF179_13520 [Thermoanaerobaculia bacterium]|nr:hypothetical protein [Thermoanaerobaculia bacterium]
MSFSRRNFWIGALIVLAAGITTGRLAAGHFFPYQEVHKTAASWKEIYNSPQGLSRGVDAVVLATVAEVVPGRTATSENGEDSLSFELVELDVVRGLKGMKAGGRITLERAAETESGFFLDMDGGPFEIGETYLLFLQRQEDGDYFYQVNHQGRFRVANDRLLAADPEDPVAARFHRRPVAQGLEMVRAGLRGRTRG